MVKKTTLYNSDNEKLYPRTSAECVGYGDGTVKDALDNTGVGDYPTFSESTAYSAGDVVNYQGKLYKFTADHAAGAWIGTDVEGTSIADNSKTAKVKLEYLDTLFTGSQSAGTTGTAVEIMAGLVPTVYDVMGSQNVILGKLFVYSDSMRRDITQVLFTSMTLDDNGALIDSHKDGITHMYYRTYGVTAPSLTNGKWTEWKQIVTELDGGTYMQTLEPGDTPITSLNNFNRCENHIYFASTPGTYTKAGNVVVEDGELALIFWNWRTKEFFKKTIYRGNISNIVQETGDSETAVMSQKAVTEKLNTVNDKIDNQIPEIEAAKDAALNEIEGTEQKAILNFNAQRVTPEMLSEGVKQLIETAGGGTINNLPDEEDITSTGSDMPVLKFKDKAYNPANFSGLGRVYLRKNIVDVEQEGGSTIHKNILTQDMINKENTVYIIQYDYDLNGETITIPEGCVLKFEGGKFNNGIIIGNNTIIYNLFNGTAITDGTFVYKDYLPDEEDVTTENGMIKFKDRDVNNDNFNITGHKIVRKEIDEKRRNTIRNQIKNADINTIFDIQYDFNSLADNDKRILIGPKILNFKGGKLHGGELSLGNNYSKPIFLTGLYEYGLDEEDLNITRYSQWQENIEGKPLVLNLCNLKGVFKKYTLKPDGITDNYDNFYNLVNHTWVKMAAERRPIIFVFDGYSDNTWEAAIDGIHKDTHNALYLFKKPLYNLGFKGRDVTFILRADIKFDFSDYNITLAKEDITSGNKVTIPRYNFSLQRFLNLRIIGIPYERTDIATYGSNTKPTIDLGQDTIVGDYYEGLEDTAGNKYYSSYNNALSIYNSENVRIENIAVRNSAGGIIVAANNTIIENVTVEGSLFDNGISVSGNELNKNTSGAVINNCRVDNCKDIGISFGGIKNGIIQNCYITNCGNDNLTKDGALNPNFGVNNSFNTGGGISIENALNGDLGDNRVLILNTKIHNCYNYGIGIDHYGATIDVIGCEINTIINTWKHDYEELIGTSFKYQAIGIRRIGAAIVVISNQENNVYVNVIGSLIKNVQYLSNNAAPVIFYGCKIGTVNGNTEYEMPTSPYRPQLINCLINEDIDIKNGLNKIDYNSEYLKIISGITVNRPSNPQIGFQYFDTTLNKPLWWNGTKWVESEGNDADSTPITSGAFANKPTGVDIGYAYFCTDRQTAEGSTNGIMTYYKGDNVWVDALGRVVS